MYWTDAHAHIWTPDTNSYPVTHDIYGDQRVPRDFTPEVLLRHSRPSGVGRFVLVQPDRYGTDNRYILDSVERFPAFFRAVVSVDPELAVNAGDMQVLLKRGVVGLHIVAPSQGMGESEGGLNYDTVFGVAAEVGYAICIRTRPGGLSDVVRMCSKHRDTVAVLDHRALIEESCSLDGEEMQAIISLSELPRAYIKVFGLHVQRQKKPPENELVLMIKNLVHVFGSERIMWGSDSPYQLMKEDYGNSISLIRDRLDFLDEADRQQVLSGTADKIFFS